MDITYLGPVDGHDVKEMVRVFNEAKRVDHAVLVHVLTKKGKGYLPAEENPAKFHGTGPFHLETGDAKESKGADTYTEVFSKVLLDIAKKRRAYRCDYGCDGGRNRSYSVCKAFPKSFF